QRQVPVPPRPSATPATQAQPPAQSQPQARSQPQAQIQPQAPAQTQPQAPAQTQPQSQPQPQSPSQASQAAYKDGTYTGQGTSRRGDVWVQVEVAGGRISNVSITRSTLQYPLRDIAGLPQEVVDRQSAQVDVVSRATYSSMAFRQAVTQALSSAKTA
ncbi:MAG TPA: FMN-binding protein, partial [Chloroflexota bacterium]|nr:FMN-binding protein [Chloroflexota bacterium]